MFLGTVPSKHILMHGLGPNLPPPPIAHDHGAALDHASHGEYYPTSSGNPGTKLIGHIYSGLLQVYESTLFQGYQNLLDDILHVMRDPVRPHGHEQWGVAGAGWVPIRA